MATGFGEASDSVRGALVEVAEGVRRELTRAGLPITEGGHSRASGAEIEVDFGDDDAGGVFVIWHADATLTDMAAQRIAEGRFDDPTIQQSGAISQAMRDSIIAILRAAEYIVDVSDDDMRPLALRVISAPPGS